jgi:hypothetical protein
MNCVPAARVRDTGRAHVSWGLARRDWGLELTIKEEDGEEKYFLGIVGHLEGAEELLRVSTSFEGDEGEKEVD